MFDVGDRVRVVLEGWKEKYPNVYTITDKKSLGNGMNLYKVGYLPDYALGSMIELVEKKSDKELRLFKKTKIKNSVFCPIQWNDEYGEYVFTGTNGDVVYEIKEAAGFSTYEECRKYIDDTFDEPSEWGVFEKVVNYKIGDVILQ